MSSDCRSIVYRYVYTEWTRRLERILKPGFFGLIHSTENYFAPETDVLKGLKITSKELHHAWVWYVGKARWASILLGPFK